MEVNKSNSNDYSKVDTEILNKKSEVFMDEVFSKFVGKDKQTFRIKRISIVNFSSLIKDKVKDTFKNFIDFANIDKYTIYNFDSIFTNKEIRIFNILVGFASLERFNLDPVMISNLANPSDFEFYWGQWNSYGKKEGFGMKIFLNGNFYFGTFKDDEMHGLGLYVFADKGENEENKQISKEKFKDNVYYSKQFFDLEKRRIDRSKKNDDFANNFKIQLQKFRENLKDNNLNYFLYLGEFVSNKFHGIGDIYHYKTGKFSGKFDSNKIIKKRTKLLHKIVR